MKSLFCTLPLILSLTKLASSKMLLKEEVHSVLQSGAANTLVSPSGKTPIVEGAGYEGNLMSFLSYGIKYKVSLDAFLGYEAPLAYYNNAGNNLLFTPNLYVEAATHNYIQIGFGFFDFRFNFDFVGFRYDLAKPVYVQSIDNVKKYCYGVDW